jgi:ACS family hexuronate transporter-like MFS transporter
VAFLTLTFGWRFAFLFTGGLGLLWLAIWLILYQPPHLNRWLRADEFAVIKNQIRPPEESAAAVHVDFKKLVMTRECLTLTLARFFTDPVIYFVIFWLPEYLRKERGFDLAMVGKYAWVPFIFGDVGYFLGGWVSGRLVRAGWSLTSARKAIMLAGAAFMPVAMLAPYVPRAWMAIGATCFITFGHAFWTANIQTLPTDLFRGPQIGTVAGFTGMGGAVGGILANLGTGYLVQRFSYTPVFLLAGLMHPLSIALVYWLLPERRFAARATQTVVETATHPA